MALSKTKATAAKPKTAGKRMPQPVKALSAEEVRLQAYYNYLGRIKNNTPGSELSDWYEAEKMVKTGMS